MFNPNTLVYISPIERWFARPGVIAYHGTDMIDKCKSVSETLCKLDPEHDEPLPEWANRLVNCKFISAIGRFMVMKEHLHDISLIKNAKKNAADRLLKEKKLAENRSVIKKELDKIEQGKSDGLEKEGGGEQK